MKKQRIEEPAGYSTGEEKAHRAATKEPTANKFADLLDRATATVNSMKHNNTHTAQNKPGNWSTMTEKEKTNWRYRK